MNNIVATGIKGLDAVLGGGIPVGTCVLLLTPPLIESKIFYMEYIYRGILANEPGMIVSMDFSPETLKAKAMEYAWDFDAGEKNGLLRWVDGYSLNAKKEVKSTNTIRRIGGSIALSDLTIGISKIQQEYAAIKPYYRYVFDSLSTLFIYNDPNTIYRFLRVIISKMRMSGGVGFLTLGEGIHDPSVEMTLRYMVDGTIHLDDHMRLNVLNLPTPSSAKSASLVLTKGGFCVDQ
jgi:KaiC/GvpD/RAD55 family RecA-like ATPase